MCVYVCVHMSVCAHTAAHLRPAAPQACPVPPTSLVCCSAAIQQEEELPCSCAQVSRLGAQVWAEAQHQHRVQQDVLVEASLQEPHLNMGAQSHPGPGLVQLPPGLAAALSPGAFFYLIHPMSHLFCGHVTKGQGRGRWLSSAYGRWRPCSLRHSPGRLVGACWRQYSPALWDGGGGTESSYCEQSPLLIPT